jgi:hypothetical protein
MVFLRLTVKVLPRDQLSSATSSFALPSVNGRPQDSTDSENVAAGRTTKFLIPLHAPEEITLGGLAGLIQEKWQKLRPDSG